MRARMVLVAVGLVVATGCGAGPHASKPRAAAHAHSPFASTSPSLRHDFVRGLTVGPDLPAHERREVESDLDHRLLLFDVTLARESPKVPKDGDFLTLEELLVGVPAASLAATRAALVDAHFEGGLHDVWDATFCSEEYDVAVFRFATPAGALDRLKMYVDGFATSAAVVRQARSAIPGGLAFLDEDARFLGRHRKIDEVFARGRYLATVSIRSGVDIAAVDLQEDADILSKAQYARMTS